MHRKVTALLALSCALSPARAAVPPIATQFREARALTGAPLELSGRVVVINFWATWCVPCRVELPLLDQYYRAHQRDGLTIVAVAMDAGAPTAALKRATVGFVMPVVPVTAVRMPRRDVPNGLPVTRVYDRHGRLRFDSARDGAGKVDAATLNRFVLPLLREP